MNAPRSDRSGAVFCDSSAFQALADSRDRYHARALTIMDRLRRTDRRMVTSNYVMAESHALILRRSNRQIALAFLDNLLGSNVRILRLEPEDEIVAIDLLRRFADKDFSFTDATSFVLMERLRIRDAFAFDEDFARYGFNLLA